VVADRHEPSVCLDIDWFFAKLRRGAIEPWRADAHAQNRTVLLAAAEACTTLAADGYVCVGEGILYPFMLDLFATAAAGRGIVLHYAVLHAPIDVVQQRVVDRKVEPRHAAALADVAVVEDLWDQFERQGVDGRHRVEVGSVSPASVAEEIDRRFRAGEFRLEPDRSG
jgi:hypothetical protein